MSLYTVSYGQVAQPTDLNQLVNLFAPPSGATETGFWYLNGNGYANGAYIGTWIGLMDHFSAPVHVSVSVTTGPSGSLGSPTVGNTTANGFNSYASFSAASTNGFEGGTYTAQF